MSACSDGSFFRKQKMQSRSHRPVSSISRYRRTDVKHLWVPRDDSSYFRVRGFCTRDGKNVFHYTPLATVARTE